VFYISYYINVQYFFDETFIEHLILMNHLISTDCYWLPLHSLPMYTSLHFPFKFDYFWFGNKRNNTRVGLSFILNHHMQNRRS